MLPVAVLLENDRRLFLKYQPYLRKAANTKIGRLFFDLTNHPKDRVFVGIFENAVAWEEENGNVTLEFLPSNHYANKLRYLLRILRLLPLALIPRLEAQVLFAAPLFVGVTMTFNPSSSAISGYVRRSVANPGEAWGTIRAGAGTDGQISFGMFVRWLGANTLNQWDQIDRGHCFFDTSAIGSGSTIGSAYTQWYLNSPITSPSDATNKRDLHVAASTVVSNTTLASSDYGSISRTSFGSIAFTSLTTLAYNQINLNASGLSGISKTGITKFSLQSSADLNNTAPNHNGTSSDELAIRIQGYSDTNKPKLVVTLSAVAKTLSDTLSLTDTPQRNVSHTLSDSLTLDDPAVDTFKGQFKEFLEVLTMTDDVRKAELTKELLDSITMSDPTVREFTLNIVETLALSDSPVVRVTAKVLLDALNFVDGLVSRLLWNRRTKPSSTWGDRTKPPTTWS